jgi:hypothetical protein
MASGGYLYMTIAICPSCHQPTFIGHDRQVPGAPVGDEVSHLPDDVSALYDEARACAKDGSSTAAVLLGRKILMHVAVEKRAPTGRHFLSYMDWLVDEHIVTAEMRDWVDEIRKLGNETNHEIVLMSPDDAVALLTFVSMLLKVVYEYPERGRRSVAARAARQAPAAPQT